MAEDEDHGDNRPEDMKIDDTILKLAEQYVSYENRARQLNKDKAGVRQQAEKLGIPSLAWQLGVRTVKIMDVKERADFQRGFKRVTSVLSKSADTLFPEDMERQAKRRSRKAEAATKAAAAAGNESPEAQERRIAADTNPKSKPKASSAKKTPKLTIVSESDGEETGDELIARVAAEKAAEQEQREGAEILDGAPKAQSTMAREKLDKLGLN